MSRGLCSGGVGRLGKRLAVLGGRWTSTRLRRSEPSRRRVVLRQCPGGANLDRPAWRTGRRYRGAWLKVTPLGSLGAIWGERCRRSAARLRAMVDLGSILPTGQTSGHWITPAAPSPACWCSTRSCANWSRGCCRASGRPNRSPQPIAGWLIALHSGALSMNVSHEAIHRSLFIQARGVLRKEILARLRSRRIMRRGRPSTTAGQTWGATSRRLLRIRLPVDRKVICGAMPETATSRRRPNAARALSCWSRSTARLTTALSAPREVGIRDAHHPNAFSVAGQKPAVRRKHPKPGVIQLCRTKGDIAAFYRRFATISSVAKESRVHHGSVRTWIKAVDLCLYSPNGELFLRDEIVVALR